MFTSHRPWQATKPAELDWRRALSPATDGKAARHAEGLIDPIHHTPTATL